MSKAIIFLISVFLLFQTTGCSPAIEAYSFSTGSPGGNYYPIGGAIAQVWSDQLENIQVNSYSSNASVANCRLLASGDAQLALVQNNVAYWAFSGIGIFEDKPNDKLRGIGSLYPEAIQLVTLESNQFSDIQDLLGKKVNVGLEGSGIYHDAINIIEAYGYTVYDFEITNHSFSEASILLEQGAIDAAFITAGYPTRSIVDLDLKSQINLIPIDSDVIEKLILTSPYYVRTIIPKDTYISEQDDIVTVTTMAMICTTTDMDDDVVYEMTKAIWDNVDKLSVYNEMDNLISFETSLTGMGIPLHKGAIRYYEEVKNSLD